MINYKMDFTKTINDIDEVSTEAIITIPTAEVDKAYEAKLADAIRKANIKGFRPGKAPRNIVERQYGARARLDSIDEVAKSAINETLMGLDRAKDIIGTPEIDFVNLSPEEPLELKAKVYYYPRPELSDLSKIEVELPAEPEVSEEDVDAEVKNFLARHAETKPVKNRKTVKAGDFIKAKFQQKAEAQEEFSPVEEIDVNVDEKIIPEKLAKKFVGLKLDQEAEFTVKYPKDLDQEVLAGKEFTYKVTVTEINTQELPEMTDELVKDSKFTNAETEEQLRAELKENIAAHQAAAHKNEKQAKLVDAIIEANSFQIPKPMIDRELEGRMRENGIEEVTAEMIANFPEEARDNAANNIRRGVIITEISEKENIKAVPDDIWADIEKQAEQSGFDVNMLKEFYSKNQQAMQDMLFQKTAEKVLAYLEEVMNTKVAK